MTVQATAPPSGDGDGHDRLMSSGEKRLVVLATLSKSVEGSRFSARDSPRVSYALPAHARRVGGRCGTHQNKGDTVVKTATVERPDRRRRPTPLEGCVPVVAVVLAILVALCWPAKGATAQTSTPPAPTPPFQVKTIGQSAGGTPLVTSNTPTGLAPATIGAVYNLRTGLVSPTSAIGAGQVIAIVDAYHDPNALSDLNAFDTRVRLPRSWHLLCKPHRSRPPPVRASIRLIPRERLHVDPGWDTGGVARHRVGARGGSRSHHRARRGGDNQLGPIS